MTINAPNRAATRQRSMERVLQEAHAPLLQRAIPLLTAGNPGGAEKLVRQQLAEMPTNAAALCILGDLAARAGLLGEAERLFRAALSEAPHFTDAEVNLAKILALRDGIDEAIALLGAIVEDEPQRVDEALTRLLLLGQIGDYALAETGYRALLAQCPSLPAAWCAFGHLLKTLGQEEACIDAFKRAIAIDPKQSDAWWGLANLKTYRFTADEIVKLQHLSKIPEAQVASQINFALGKAYEDRAEFDQAFAAYSRGNDARRTIISYAAADMSAEVDRSIAYFSRDLFLSRAAAGSADGSPIFVVGLPRSGSTLVEQILASHPDVEGTAELPYIPMLVHRVLEQQWRDRTATFPDVLNAVSDEGLTELGDTYLAAAALHRRQGKRLFVDKLPNNWAYVGFIKLILPNANIIDARRLPMACGWSNYRQWFARGQEFSYSLADIGRYYRDYHRLMTHFDAVLGDAVHRVNHEVLVANPQQEIPRLLDAVGLHFHTDCMTFYKNERPVRTASAQQVRQPLDAKRGEQWRHFEPWLEPLREALRDLA